MAVDADMVDVITSNAERHIAQRSSGRLGKTEQPAFATHSSDDLLVEVIIDLADVDIESLEKQLEMAFGNLVKRRTEVKISTLTAQRKK